MHGLQDPNQTNVDNLNNVTRKPSRHFKKNKKEYLQAKIEELETVRQEYQSLIWRN
jgi:hypothetical protein